MKKNIRRILSVIMVIALLVSLTGCPKDPAPPKGPTEPITESNGRYSLPAWVSDLIAQHGELEDDKKAANDYKVNFYFDSTVSMAGYIGMLDRVSRPLSDGGQKFNLLMNAFRDTNQKFKSKAFYKIGLVGKSPSWVENSAGFADCKTPDFYAYGDEYNSLNNVGPLNLLFFEENSKFNYDDVNIISSDLAEQNVKLNDIAGVLTREVLSKPGYTVYLLAVTMPFSGKASYTHPNTGALDGDVIDVSNRPLYFIMTGPSKAVEYYYAQFCNDFGRQYQEGTDFFVAKYNQTGGVETVMYNKIKTTASWENMLDRKTWSGLFDNKDNQWNMNLNVNQLDDNQFKSKFTFADGQEVASSGKVALNAFEYQTNDKNNPTGTGRMVLNYYIPVVASEGELNAENIEFWVNNEKYEETNSPAINDAKAQQNFMNYSYLTYVEAETTTSAEKKIKQKTDKKPVWCNLSDDLDKVNAEEIDIEYEVEILRAGDIPAYTTTINNQVAINNNLKAKSKDSRFYDETYKPSAEDADKEFVSQSLFTEDDYDKDFTEDTMVIHVCVKGYIDDSKYTNIKLSGDTVVFDLPIYAVDRSQVNNNIPNWVSSLDSGSTFGSGSAEDYGLTHTYNLQNFYQTLFNVGIDDDELQKYECSTLIADIITVIA